MQEDNKLLAFHCFMAC